MKTCEHCGKPLPKHPWTRRYCVKCEIEERVCETCGKHFRVKRARDPENPARFCSHACYSKSLIVHPDKTFQCKSCGKPFTRSDTNKNLFCSESCRSRFVSQKRHAGEPSKLIKVNCDNCGKELLITRYRFSRSRHHCCSQRCAFELHACSSFGDEKKRSGHRTDIEQTVERFLIRRGVAYKFEYQFGRYSIDFAVVPDRIAIECDGLFWHRLPKDLERDARKDAYIVARGWKVVRLSEPDIESGEFENVLVSILTPKRD